MKILFVAMSDSIHTARWIEQIVDQKWDLHLFPSIEIGQTHPELKNVTVYHTVYKPNTEKKTKIKNKGFPIFSKNLATVLAYGINLKCRHYRIKKLIRLIKKIKPDIIHTMETQAAGYLTSQVRSQFKNRFPIWVHSIWGSDLYLFGKLKEHKSKIDKVLSQCDYLICESIRDKNIAQQLGFNKNILLNPVTAGFDMAKTIQKTKTSKRKLIILKGYQTWSGRALTGLRALERCADQLKGYTIAIYSPIPFKDITIAAKLFTFKTSIPTQIIPLKTSYSQMLKFCSRSRLSIGLSISDGVPNTMIEAMATGSFPIQSDTSCANEWIKNGRTGFLVPPEDPEIIEKAIRKALTDDKLVDAAAKTNWRIVKKRLDEKILKNKVIDFYKTVESK